MKRGRLFVGLLALVAVLTPLFFGLTRHTSKQLRYRGKPIEYWFGRLPVTPVPPPGVDVRGLMNIRGFIKTTGQQYGSTNLFDDGGIAAIAALGTNALPFLLVKLQGSDSIIEKTVTRAATNTGVSAYPSGLLVWEHLESGEPRDMRGVSPEHVLEMWLRLSRGELAAIDAEPWKAGYG